MKFVLEAVRLLLLCRPPRGGRGLKLEPMTAWTMKIFVAPLAGGVD